MDTEKLYELFLQANAKVCTDTRKIESGSLFISLRGANFNANEFAREAINKGCKFALVDEEKYADGSTIFYVENTLTTLQNLANHHRKKFSIPVLAITGSNAKTTHKELISTALGKKYKCLATVGNLNNHIGVPLTLLCLNKEHEFAIIEMGANHQGEIDQLCRIAEPDYGIITNIGKAHLEGFGGIEGVKKGKSELYRYIASKSGKVFICGDDEVLQELAKGNDKISYGVKKLYDVIGKDESNYETVVFKWTTRYGEKNWSKLPLVKTQITGRYNFINCLAAVCVANYFKVEDALINQALSEYVPSMNRSQLVQTEANKIILDAYNANPSSMKAAIENFASIPGQEKCLLLGDMFELGEESVKEHQLITELIAKYTFSKVILVGKEFEKTNGHNYLKFPDTDTCSKYLQNNKITHTLILIKGSRGMKMESLITIL